MTKYQRYYARNSDARKRQKREWAKRNAQHVKEYQRAWIAKQPPKFWYRWPSRPPRKSRKLGRTYVQQLEANRITRKQMRDKLSDSYLRGWMSRQTGYRISPSEWPDNLVQLKRAQLKLKRLCRESQPTTN